MVSLTLSPALAALLLKPRNDERRSGIWTTLSRPTNIFFAGFNKLFERLALGYSGLTRRALRVSALMLIIYGGVLGGGFFLFTPPPSCFLPPPRPPLFLPGVSLPPGAGPPPPHPGPR